MRVDIDIQDETLKWLGVQAATIGISRRTLMRNIITRHVALREPKEIPSYIINPMTPEECYDKLQQITLDK